MFEEKIQIDIAVIGGGIVGLWSAYLLKQKRPELEIVLIEKNAFLGDETTGRNSGVLHSGLYYPTNSLKHLLCLEGYDHWLSFCKKFQVPFSVCGKYLISNDSEDQNALEKYFNQAQKNGVKVIPSDQKTVAKLQHHLNVSEAFFVPSSGIIDIPSAVRQLKNLAESLGVIVLSEHELREAKVGRDNSNFELAVKTPSDTIKVETTFLINAAGLGAVRLRSTLGLDNFQNYWVKGNYLRTSQKLDYKSLYYPVPSSDLKGLGIHSTIDIEGFVKFGPNTEDLTNTDFANYSLDANQRELMLNGVRKMFKNVDMEKLYLDYCGIRPKLKNSKDSKVYTDFYIGSGAENNMPTYFEFLGIESPGVTAAPALAAKLVNMIFKA